MSLLDDGICFAPSSLEGSLKVCVNLLSLWLHSQFLRCFSVPCPRRLIVITAAATVITITTTIIMMDIGMTETIATTTITDIGMDMDLTVAGITVVVTGTIAV